MGRAYYLAFLSAIFCANSANADSVAYTDPTSWQEVFSFRHAPAFESVVAHTPRAHGQFKPVATEPTAILALLGAGALCAQRGRPHRRMTLIADSHSTSLDRAARQIGRKFPVHEIAHAAILPGDICVVEIPLARVARIDRVESQKGLRCEPKRSRAPPAVRSCYALQ